ncbi:MAG: hypothetical protein LBR17_01310 [Bacteroidales bacterium]|jgi:Trk-type K+ transport system membrane component|nr:hypothetical protein [Bacteroidales bacterium]
MWLVIITLIVISAFAIRWSNEDKKFDTPEQEKAYYSELRQRKDIHLIKNIALFWCIITIIGMIIAIILIITGSHAAADYPRY